MKTYNFYLELHNLTDNNKHIKFLITREKNDILAESYQFSNQIIECKSTYNEIFIQKKISQLFKNYRIRKIYVRNKNQKQIVENFLIFHQSKVEIINILDLINKKLNTEFSSFEGAFKELGSYTNKGSMTAVYELKELLENHKSPKPQVETITAINNFPQYEDANIPLKTAAKTVKTIPNKSETPENYNSHQWERQPIKQAKQEINNQQQGCWEQLLEILYTIIMFLFIATLFSKC